MVKDAQVLRRLDVVPDQGGLLALHLAGKLVVGELAVGERHRGLGVAQGDASGQVDGVELVVVRRAGHARGDAAGGHALGAAEERHHGGDRIDAHVAQGPRGHARVKDVEALPRPESGNAARHLGEGHLGQADLPQGSDLALDGGKAGRVEVAHGLHCHDAGLVGGTEELGRLALVGAEGLLHQDVLSSGHEDLGLADVQRVGA